MPEPDDVAHTSLEWLNRQVADDDLTEPLLDFDLLDELVIDLRDAAPKPARVTGPDHLLRLVLNRARYQRAGMATVGAMPSRADALSELADLVDHTSEPRVLDLIRKVPPRST